MQQIVIYW